MRRNWLDLSVWMRNKWKLIVVFGGLCCVIVVTVLACLPEQTEGVIPPKVSYKARQYYERHFKSNLGDSAQIISISYQENYQGKKIVPLTISWIDSNGAYQWRTVYVVLEKDNTMWHTYDSKILDESVVIEPPPKSERDKNR